ncbi:MAG TPA: tripartite tricarboxylate transporter substrate binding protein [Xanthobacteraceae bacterium]|nr:tripartite tricarboxylate transporter substrate binding protein [Xanthobacteraceae bacterium]
MFFQRAYLALRSSVLAALAFLLIQPAMAQTPGDSYPQRQIKIIVPFPPGGSTDTLARVLAQNMQDDWGQTVIVENRPGASTIVGSQAAAKAEPDGYTLIVVVGNHATNPALHSKLPYDTLKDFEPISYLGHVPIVVYANPAFPAANLKDLVAITKKQPVNFGSAGLGSTTHLAAESFKIEANIDMSHIVYRGGTPAMTDAIAGQIPMTWATVGQALQQYRAGQLKPLGIAWPTRYAAVPEIPTFKEQGFDVVGSEWYALLAPAGTPKPIIAKLNAEVRKITARKDLGDKLQAVELSSSSPEELQTFIKNEIDKWTPLINKLGLKAD